MLCQCGCSATELSGVARPVGVRVAAFFDGQNLSNSARRCFDEQMPTFDPRRLAEDAIKRSPILSRLPAKLVSVNFYTGVHKASYDPFWARFWQVKLARFGLGGSADIEHRSTTRTLAYADGVAREKGIDVRIALDVLSFANEAQYDAAIIFSQDKDLSEAVADVRAFATKHRRWIHLETAFLWATGSSRNQEKIDKHGLPGTCWTKIPEAAYRACAETENVAAATGNSLLSSGDGPNFVLDLLDAFHSFKNRNGYLGVNYLVEKWRFHRCPVNPNKNWFRSMMLAACAVGLAKTQRHPNGEWELLVDTKHALIPAIHRTV